MRIAFLILLALLGPVFALAVEEGTEPATKTLVWPDGTRYVGGVSEGKRTGKGTIFWQDGTRFVGQFVNDMRNGPGTMILPDGTVYTGIFKDDELVGSPAEGTESIAKIDPAEHSQKPVSQASIIATTEPETEPEVDVEKAAITPELESAEESSTASENKPITEFTNDVRHQLIETVDLWGAAWSDKNVPQYLSNYSKDFVVPGKLDRKSWEGLRRARLNRPKYINVSITHEKINFISPDTADVYFEQTYRSNTYSDVTRKQLRLRKEGHAWMILTEQSR
jgi:hypothetical protein